MVKVEMEVNNSLLNHKSNNSGSSARRRIISPISTTNSSPKKQLSNQQNTKTNSNNHNTDSRDEEELGPIIDVRGERLTLLEEIVLLGLDDRKGYLSFMNDSISYVLRGCVLIELGLRGRIGCKTPSPTLQTQYSTLPSECRVCVRNSEGTGEVLLDEALRLMGREEHSIGGWMNLLSGETWNPLKINFQIKQLRERTAKGLVDKGVLGTDKQSFIIFKMATHPLLAKSVKMGVVGRLLDCALARGSLPSRRQVSLLVCAMIGNVLECHLDNRLSSTERRSARRRAEEMLDLYAGGGGGGVNEKGDDVERIIGGVFCVFSNLDNLYY